MGVGFRQDAEFQVYLIFLPVLYNKAMTSARQSVTCLDDEVRKMRRIWRVYGELDMVSGRF